MRHACVVLFVAAAALCAQTPETQPARIEGRVLVKDTKTPVSGAQVRFAGKVGTSGEDGSFVLEGLAPGAALGTITAAKAGFLDGGASAQATAVSLAPGGTLKDALVYLLPQSIISGRITDSRLRCRIPRHRYGARSESSIPGWDRAQCDQDRDSGKWRSQCRGAIDSGGEGQSRGIEDPVAAIFLAASRPVRMQSGMPMPV